MTSLATRGAIVIVRHGETDWNAARRIQGQTEVPLNDTGRAQARQTAALLLQTGPWHRVVSSPLGRAAETAGIIAQELGLAQPDIDRSVLERDFGAAEGVPVVDAHRRWPGLDVPDAEPLDSLALRGAQAFSRILRETPGAIVVAHGALIRAALEALSGGEIPRILNGEAWTLSRPSTGIGTLRVGRLGAATEAPVPSLEAH